MNERAFSDGAQAATVYMSDGTANIVSGTLSYQSPASLGYTFSIGNQGGQKRIGPRLYFNYVKSKLTKTQQKNLKARLQKLQALVRNAQDLGQLAAYESFSKMLLVAVRESEAAACGYDVFVTREDVTKFIDIVSESDEDRKRIVHFKTLEEFPRPIPANIQKKVKALQTKGIFDKLHVLYLDYSGEKVKSTKEKIREKDPIIFGQFSYDDNRLYFIADWVDEYCDLTLSDFVDALKEKDEAYDTSKVEEITPEYLERIKAEIKDREDRLRNTNPSNWRNNMSEEDRLAEKAKDRAKWREEANQELKEILEAKDKELQEARNNRPWYKKIFG